MTDVDHTQLQAWIRTRDADAFNGLAKRYAGIVFGACLRVTGNHAEAEDATQECFETLARIAEPPRTPLGAWLHRVATNRALDRVRSAQRRTQREQRYAREQSPTIEPGWNDIQNMVDEAIAGLPEQLRIPVVAHFLEGESYTEVAQSLGITRQAATKRVEKGVRALRNRLQKRGLSVSAASLVAMLLAELPPAAAAALPATMLAGLGKIAIAGAQLTTTTATAAGVSLAGATTLGGIAMSKSTITAIAAAGAIVCAGVIYTVSRDEAAPKSKLAQASNAVDVNSSQTHAATAPADAEVARLQHELARANARIEALEANAAEAISTPAQSASSSAKAEDSEDEGDARELHTLEEFQRRARDVPEAMMRAKAINGLMFGGFLIDANLEPEVEEQVRAFINEMQINMIAAQQFALRETDDMTWGDLARLRNRELADLTQDLQPLLNDEQQAMWQATAETTQARVLEQSLRGEIGMLATALTAENMETAIGVGVDAFLSEQYALEDADAHYTPTEMVHYRRRAIHAMRAQLPAYMPADQMTEVENYLTFADNMLDAQLEDAMDAEETLAQRRSENE